jgi:Peptidase family M28
LRALTRVAALTALAATPLLARSAPAPQISPAQLRAYVTGLVSFGTRHTLSSADDPKRGIGAARRWAEGEFRKSSAACGGCLEIALPENTVTGERMPRPVKIVDVLAIQRGTERPNEVVIVQGHIDSRVTDVMNATADAPGANDDGSGTALVLEAARVLSQRKFPTTIVYAVLTGEEQGLFGGKLLAQYAKQQGWTVKAVLNNDIVGNTRGADGVVEDKVVRVFSEGPRADGDDALRAAVRRFGGENDSPSRNLSRFVDGLASPELDVRQVWRTDRMGRGGDHIPFLDAGYPAIRFSVGIENYDHQHQDLRTEGGKVYGDTIEFMDFAYLAKVTRLNIKALAALASAPMPPVVQADGAVSTSTRLKWRAVPGATWYRLYRRRTDAPGWSFVQHIYPGAPDKNGFFATELAGVRADDWLFGMSAVAGDKVVGAESPIASAVPGGQSAPLR